MAATVVLLLLCGTALAWFTGTTSGQGRISTGTWTTGLTFHPGWSTATNYTTAGRPSPAPVAKFGAGGGIALDFGDVRAGTAASWCDVMRVTSSDSQALRVAFTVTGDAAGLVTGVSFTDGGSVDGVDPGQTRRVGVRIVVPKDAAPGASTGILTASVVGTGERYDFPLTVAVFDKRPRPSPSPSCTASASCSPSPSCSPRPSGSPDPSCSPSPSGSPAAVLIYTMTPGESTVLPGPAVPSPAPAVARLLPDGVAIGLDFGTIPAARAVVFPDVLRLTSVADKTAQVEFALSGPVAESVRNVGFWDADREVVTQGLTLQAGETVRIALEFEPPLDEETGPLEGALTVSARLGQEVVQRCEMTVTVTVEPDGAWPTPDISPDASPGADGSPEPESAPEPASSPALQRESPGSRLLAGGARWLPLAIRLGVIDGI